jgi:phospholipase/carboxylesterase
MKSVEQTFGELSALVVSPIAEPKKALVLFHGVGSNESDLLEIAPLLSEDRLIISMRAPLTMAPNSYAWFHVQFAERGPVHNWNEAKVSLSLIEDALRDLSKKTGIPFAEISVFGFSQGAIMILGLALTSELGLENYIASSGRTLPEFAEESRKNPLNDFQLRRVFVTHGIEDSRLPIQLGRQTEKILRDTALKLVYKEYHSGHEISPELLADAKEWLSSK